MYLRVVDLDPTGWAPFRCGIIYQNRNDYNHGLTPPNPAKANEFYRKSLPLLLKASDNNTTAYALGRLYRFGEGGLQEDKEEALKLYRLAAKKGKRRTIRARADVSQRRGNTTKKQQSGSNLLRKADTLKHNTISG